MLMDVSIIQISLKKYQNLSLAKENAFFVGEGDAYQTYTLNITSWPLDSGKALHVSARAID